MNNIKELDANDIVLIKKTYDFVIQNCNDNHPLGTGILHNTNHIIYGISSNSPLAYDVHGEHVAIGNSHVFGLTCFVLIGGIYFDNCCFDILSNCSDTF